MMYLCFLYRVLYALSMTMMLSIEPETTMGTYSLRVMIINPNEKRDYVMVKAEGSSTANLFGFDDIKKLILASFPPDVPQPHADKLEFGYIVPGHGLRGKKERIFDDSDAKEFLAKIKNKKKAESALWCYSQAPTSSKGQNKRESSKRSRSRSPITKSGSS